MSESTARAGQGTRPPDVKTTAGSTSDSSEISLLIALGTGIRFVRLYRRILLRASLIFLLMGIALALVIPSKYTARATILPPESGSSAFSRILAALPMGAAQMLSPGGDSKMVELYVDIAKSQSVLTDVLNADYHGSPFRDALRSSGDTPDWKLIQDVQESFAGSKNPRTQLVMFELTNRDPALAAALLTEILRQMDSFFRYRVATNENVQRRLIETRLSEVADSLRSSEDLLRQFKEGNRTTLLSPKLTLEEGRLMREVEINNALYIELTKQLELAKINEAETMPILNVLDYPAIPQLRSGPSRAIIVVGTLAFGLLLAALYINFWGIVPVRVRRLADRALKWQHTGHD